MSWKHLGETFDIHGGGIDLVFPHHENEVAQSCCAFHTERMAQTWMHNGFLQVEGEKMSKSLGNFITIRELLATNKFGGRSWDGATLRLAMLKTHYRQPIDWTVDALHEAEKAILDWSDFAKDATPVRCDEVIAALTDDLNTPKMIAELHALRRAGKADELRGAMQLLGINPVVRAPVDLDATAKSLIEARTAARANKDWKESDRIRDELAAMGVVLKDGKDADGKSVTTWELAR